MTTNLRVRVVDDFSTMRRMIKNLLEGLGFQNIAEADGGRMALPILQSGGFDFVITDWNMPIMPGLELLRAIRADARRGPAGPGRSCDLRKA